MAAYYKVEVSLSTNSVTVGAPSAQEVLVTLPLVGPAGATGAQGPAGAGAVESVNDQTGVVLLDAEDVGALQSAFSIETFVYYAGIEMTLPARRNVRWQVQFIVEGSTRTLFLPSEDVQVGDRIHVALTVPNATTLIVKKPQPGGHVLLATLSGGARFLYAAQVTQIISGQPNWQSLGELQATIGAVPTSSNDTGTIGSFVFAEQFMYVCIADDTWRRVPIADF